MIGHSSTKCPGLSVLTVIPPVLSFRYLFLVALLKSKGSWLTRFGYWVPNSAFRNSQRIAFRVNMKSYPSKVWMATAQKWNKWLTHIEHRTGVAEKVLYVTTQFQYGRVAALLRYRNCAEITSPIRIEFFEFQTRDIRSPSLPPKGALFAVYSTPVGIAREVDYR